MIKILCKRDPPEHKYKGEVDENNLFHGQGMLTTPAGDVFIGTFDHGKPHGYGEFRWKNGGHFVGYFDQGIITGKGKETYPDGSEYEGDFAANKRWGQGTMRYDNGTVYRGEWKQGKKDGKGTIHLLDNGRFEGVFRDGKRNGPGVLRMAGKEPMVAVWTDGKISKKLDALGKGVQWQDPRFTALLTLDPSTEIQPDDDVLELRKQHSGLTLESGTEETKSEVEEGSEEGTTSTDGVEEQVQTEEGEQQEGKQEGEEAATEQGATDESEASHVTDNDAAGEGSATGDSQVDSWMSVATDPLLTPTEVHDSDSASEAKSAGPQQRRPKNKKKQRAD